MVIKILKSPITLFISIFVGILLGIYVPWTVPILSVFNTIFLSLLQVCVIPIVACAIIINIGKMFRKEFRKMLFNLFIFVIIFMMCAALLGIMSVMLTRDFITPDAQTKSAFSNIIGSGADTINMTKMFDELSFYGKNQIEEIKQFSFADFIFNAIPSNIFTALSDNNIMQVLLFSCAFGIMLSFINKRCAEPLIIIATSFYKAFCKLMEYLIIVLPIAICSMLAEQFSGGNLELSQILNMLAKFIGINYIVAIIIILGAFILIQIKTRCSIKEHLSAVKRIFFISIATSSCIASTSTLIEDIPGPFKLNKKLVSSIAPISILLFQPGTIAGAALLAMYSTTIYSVNVNLNLIFIVLIGSMVFSMSSAGLPGLVAANMLSIILQPIGVPSELMILIFLSSVMFFQGIIVFASLYSNIAIMTLVLSPRKKKMLLARS